MTFNTYFDRHILVYNVLNWLHLITYFNYCYLKIFHQIHLNVTISVGKNPYVYVLTLIGPTLFAIKKSISILTLICTKHLIFSSLSIYIPTDDNFDSMYVTQTFYLYSVNFMLCKLSSSLQKFWHVFATQLYTSKR